MYLDVILVNQQMVAYGGWVLLAVAIMGAFTIFIKTFFAVIYHIYWLFCERCCLKLMKNEPHRLETVDKYWKKEMLNWNNQYQNRVGESVIYKKKP